MQRILFVHPDRKFSQLYLSRLKPFFSVDSADNGLNAMRKFKTSPASLIVSEYDLPVLSGISLLKAVRSHPVYTATPFIFFTSYHDNSEALSLGANDWIEIHTSHPDLLIERIYHNLKVNRYVQIN